MCAGMQRAAHGPLMPLDCCSPLDFDSCPLMPLDSCSPLRVDSCPLVAARPLPVLPDDRCRLLPQVRPDLPCAGQV
eukprot:363427-Chlamydomonas_euryale.AAC.3